MKLMIRLALPFLSCDTKVALLSEEMLSQIHNLNLRCNHLLAHTLLDRSTPASRKKKVKATVNELLKAHAELFVTMDFDNPEHVATSERLRAQARQVVANNQRLIDTEQLWWLSTTGLHAPIEELCNAAQQSDHEAPATSAVAPRLDAQLEGQAQQ